MGIAEDFGMIGFKTIVSTPEEINHNRRVWLDRYMFQIKLDPIQCMDWKEAQIKGGSIDGV